MSPDKKLFALVVILCLSFSEIYYVGHCRGYESITLYVGGSGFGNYSSITQALDNATSNETIFVFHGIYHENIKINSSISIIGENKESTFIDGTIEVVNAKYVTLHNLNISAGRKQLDNYNSLSYTGLVLDSVSSSIIENCIISAAGDGISCSNSNNISILYNNLTKNSEAILCDGIVNCLIEYNTIARNGAQGIDLSGRNNIVRWNTISHNIWGLTLSSSANLIANNTFFMNRDGIDISAIRTMVLDVVHNTTRYVYSSTNNTIYSNVFRKNNRSASDQGQNQWYNPVTLRGNYWDDYNGTDINGDGVGDEPYNISGGTNQDKFPLLLNNISKPHPVENASNDTNQTNSSPNINTKKIPVFTFTLFMLAAFIIIVSKKFRKKY